MTKLYPFQQAAIDVIMDPTVTALTFTGYRRDTIARRFLDLGKTLDLDLAMEKQKQCEDQDPAPEPDWGPDNRKARRKAAAAERRDARKGRNRDES